MSRKAYGPLQEGATVLRPAGSPLGAAIRRLRLRIGLTQSQFATEIGAKGHESITVWEAGKVVPGGPYLLAMLELLECGPEAEILEQALAASESEGRVARLLREEFRSRTDFGERGLVGRAS